MVEFRQKPGDWNGPMWLVVPQDYGSLMLVMEWCAENNAGIRKVEEYIDEHSGEREFWLLMQRMGHKRNEELRKYVHDNI